MNYLHNRYWNDVSLPTILWKINLQLIFVAFISLNGFTQEKANENPVTKEKTILINTNLQTNISKSDSLKRIEARRIYMTPIPKLEGKKEKNK